MDFYIRVIDKESDSELSLVTKRTMDTVLETIPEFEGSEDIARKAFPNFSFIEMKKMIKKDFDNKNHRLLLAISNKTNEILGHAIFSLKTDDNDKKYGFCFSRYVIPEARKIGIGSLLLKEQEIFWKNNHAEYIIAHTHQKNVKLQNLFLKHDYKMRGPIKGDHYHYFALKKDIKIN
ncbi:MAG: GNAT family N-acetyltransferase [Bdellovibrionales bacterium]|jgi:hypothetical protein|nr:GNAT family N-acetyltransferase [Bdellovibrionales bacterium]